MSYDLNERFQWKTSPYEMEETRKEGVIAGRYAAAIRIARIMKFGGIPLDQNATITKRRTDEIENL